MTNKARVMICDDSAVMRRILTTVLPQDGSLEVVYRAQNGRDLLDNLDAARPDVIVLDVEMPVMDGVETVASIRRRGLSLPIVMFSSLTSSGAEATMDALKAGADDFCTKPSGVGHIDRAVQSVRDDLVTKIKTLVRNRRQKDRPPLGHYSPAGPAPEPSRFANAAPPRQRKPNTAPADIVAIGVSTGGPKTLHQILSGLPANISVPIVIVQHMPPLFTEMLAERLNKSCSINVREAKNGTTIRPGEAWIAPGDYHMKVARSGTEVSLELDQGSQEHSVRPAVDPLFRSVAKLFGSSGLGVVLTGMGKDGLDGSRAIHQAGGSILTQDEATSAVWGMPRVVTEAGLSHACLPLDQIAAEITRRVRRSASVAQ